MTEISVEVRLESKTVYPKAVGLRFTPLIDKNSEGWGFFVPRDLGEPFAPGERYILTVSEAE